MFVQCTRTSPVEPTFHTHQVLGLFDLPPLQSQSETFRAAVPALDDDWRIGAIVGPSGSGKTTIAKAAYGEAALLSPSWEPNRAIIEQFDEHSLLDAARILTSVGLGSAPLWLRPYSALSSGEQFRCNLAKRLLQRAPIIVCDEFAALLERNLARNIAISLEKRIRSGQWPTRLVAITTHDDILPWLAPDWTLDMSERALHWRRLRRPELQFAVRRCDRSLWPRFAAHHYLSSSLPCPAWCYAAWEEDRPIAFCAVAAVLGHPGLRRISRLVAAPQYQGLGVGGMLLDRVAQDQRDAGYRVHITTSHPGMVALLLRSRNWRFLGRRFRSDPPRAKGGAPLRTARGRLTAAFEFAPSDRRAAVEIPVDAAIDAAIEAQKRAA